MADSCEASRTEARNSTSPRFVSAGARGSGHAGPAAVSSSIAHTIGPCHRPRLLVYEARARNFNPNANNERRGCERKSRAPTIGYLSSSNASFSWRSTQVQGFSRK